MKFRIASLLSLLPSISFFHSSALSMQDEGDKRSYISSKRSEDSSTKMELSEEEIGTFAVTYTALRKSGNTASDQELVAYILDKKWDQLTLEERDCVVAKVSGKPSTKMGLSGEEIGTLTTTYTAIRKTGNIASDRELVAYILDKKWGWLTPEEQERVVAKVSGKPYEEVKDTAKLPAVISAEQDATSTIAGDIEAAKKGNISPLLERLKQVDTQISKYTTLGDKDFVRAYLGQKKRLEAVLERVNPKHPHHFSLNTLAKGLAEGQERITSLERIQKYEKTVPEYFRQMLPLTIKEFQSKGDSRPVRAIVQGLFFDNDYGDTWNNLGEEGQDYLVAQISGKPTVKVAEREIEEAKTKVAITTKPKLPAILSKDIRPSRERFSYQGKNFSEYNVYMAGNNCGLNALDVLRKDAISSLGEHRKELPGDLPTYLDESKEEGANFDHMLLPYVGRFLLGANINVLQKPEEGKILVPTMMAFLPEYLPPDPALPTLNFLWEGQHYRILVLEEETEAVDLLRDYAKTKEYLAFEAEKLVQVDESDGAYAKATNMQFLNDGKGGWLKSYVDWLKSQK